MKNNKWLFVCIIFAIVLLTVGIIYQFVKIKQLEHKIAEGSHSSITIVDYNSSPYLR